MMMISNASPDLDNQHIQLTGYVYICLLDMPMQKRYANVIIYVHAKIDIMLIEYVGINCMCPC